MHRLKSVLGTPKGPRPALPDVFDCICSIRAVYWFPRTSSVCRPWGPISHVACLRTIQFYEEILYGDGLMAQLRDLTSEARTLKAKRKSGAMLESSIKRLGAGWGDGGK